MYYRYIYKYHCGEKRWGGVPRFEEVTAKKENLLEGNKRENFARNTHELLVALGVLAWWVCETDTHTNFNSFSGSEESALPGGRGGGRRGTST